MFWFWDTLWDLQVGLGPLLSRPWVPPRVLVNLPMPPDTTSRYLQIPPNTSRYMPTDDVADQKISDAENSRGKVDEIPKRSPATKGDVQSKCHGDRGVGT